MDTSPALTPAEAAKRARVSRTTIVRALQARELLAFRDNAGRWNISPEAVDEWRKRRRHSVHNRVMDTDRSAEIAHLRAELDAARDASTAQAAQLARLTAELAAAEARAATATDERDAWRAQAAALAQRPEPSPLARRGPLRFLRFFKRE